MDSLSLLSWDIGIKVASTNVKDVNNDYYLKINPDGSINVVGGGGGGGSNGFSSITPGLPAQIAVGTTSIVLLVANTLRKYAHFFNNSTEAIFLQFQGTAALNQGIKVGPGSFYTLETSNLYLGDINAIGLVTGQLISVVEGI